MVKERSSRVAAIGCNCIEPPSSRASARLAIVVDFDRFALGCLKFEPVPFEIRVAAIGLRRAPRSKNLGNHQRSPIPREGARNRWLATARLSDETVARRRHRPAHEPSHVAFRLSSRRAATLKSTSKRRFEPMTKLMLRAGTTGCSDGAFSALQRVHHGRGAIRPSASRIRSRCLAATRAGPLDD